MSSSILVVQKESYPVKYEPLVRYTERMAKSMKLEYISVSDMYRIYRFLEDYDVLFIGHDVFLGVESNTLSKVLNWLSLGKIVSSHEPLAVVAYPRIKKPNPDRMKIELNKQPVLEINNHAGSYIWQI